VWDVFLLEGMKVRPACALYVCHHLFKVFTYQAILTAYVQHAFQQAVLLYVWTASGVGRLPAGGHGGEGVTAQAHNPISLHLLHFLCCNILAGGHDA
jgi:hypothetical protein